MYRKQATKETMAKLPCATLGLSHFTLDQYGLVHQVYFGFNRLNEVGISLGKLAMVSEIGS